VRYCQTNPFAADDVNQLFDRDQLLGLECTVMPKTAISQPPALAAKKRPEIGVKKRNALQCPLLAPVGHASRDT
jgi:hypothetical protein